jgi:hypothetical protein
VTATNKFEINLGAPTGDNLIFFNFTNKDSTKPRVLKFVDLATTIEAKKLRRTLLM